MTDQAHSHEVHITLAAHQESLNVVRAWAGAQGIKWTHILLEGGRTASQPMMTFWGTGTIDTLLIRAKAITDAVRTMGVDAVRIKIEASIENSEIPASAVPQNESESGYFEYHFKLLLSAQFDRHRLTDLVVPFGARLSRNARRQRDDGHTEHFVTQRAAGGNRRVAQSQCEQLRTALQTAGYEILELESEYVVFDSNLALDSGWLERGEQT